MTERVIWVPFLPPSLNETYENIKVRKASGARFSTQKMTDKGRSFKRRFSAEVVPRHTGLILEASEILEDINIVMAVRLTVYFESLTTKGWPKTAKNRYRVVDADNRGKITFDCFKEALGSIDDSRFFVMGTEKHQGPAGVQLSIHYQWCSDFGIPEVEL